jgi:hypothetical protein
MEGEDRRGRESGQNDHRLSIGHCQADRLAGLERHAMNHNAGVRELADGVVGQIARALRGSSREQHQVVVQALRKQRVNFALDVARPAQLHRLAPGLCDRGGKNGAVGVVDAAQGARLTGSNELVAGGKNGHLGLAPGVNLGQTDGRQRADLPRGDDLARAQNGLTLGDVAARGGDECARRNGSVDVGEDLAVLLARLGLLDHHHGVGAARNQAAGGDYGRSSLQNLRLGQNAGGENLGVEPQGARRIGGGSVGVGRAHGKAVDPRAIEAGNVHLGHHVARKNAPQGSGPGNQFFSQRLQVQGTSEISPRPRRARFTSRNCCCCAARKSSEFERSLS